MLRLSQEKLKLGLTRSTEYKLMVPVDVPLRKYSTLEYVRLCEALAPAEIIYPNFLFHISTN